MIPLKNPRGHSPLRYPGGKACLTHFIANLAKINGREGGIYVELYAGGAGAALNMLFEGTFNHIHINDYDYNIFSVWYSVLNDTDNFIRLIKDTPVTIDEWHRQRDIYKSGKTAGLLALGFATFFLNRTNRSGIIFKAGPIGGRDQTGNYLIDVRFNKDNLIERVERIANHRDQITLTNTDAVQILKHLQDYHPDIQNIFLYLDPPYYQKGKQLYLNNYSHDDHKKLANTVAELDNEIKWLISYDNIADIRQLYQGYRMSCFDLNYTLQSKKFGSELLVFSHGLEIGDKITVNQRSRDLTLLTEETYETVNCAS